MSVSELSGQLGLTAITTHNVHIQDCCAINGNGLLEGMKWLAQNVQVKRQVQAAISSPAPAVRTPA
jgi:hypothetical protein